MEPMNLPDDLPARLDTALRNRLLWHIAGLAMVLVAAILLFATGSPSGLQLQARALLAVILTAAGLVLLLSMHAMVQHQLLEPLISIRHWAARVRNNTAIRPLATGTDIACSDLADDLNSITRRLRGTTANQPMANNDDTGLEQDALKILYDVVSSINTAHSLDDLLTRFLYMFKRITRAHGAAIWVEHKHQEPELCASSGIDEDLLLPERHDFRRCLYERAATEGKIWVEETLDKCEKIAGRRFFEKDHIGLVSVPMRYRGMITGVINLFLDHSIIEHVGSIKPLLTSIAHHLSIAIERYHNEEEHRDHLIKEERTRLAHELHDSLAQTLASLRFQVRVLDETMHQGDESTTWQQLERIENSLDEANTELRGLIANFRAPAYQRGLVQAIEQIVSQFRNETGIRTYLQKDMSASSFPKDTETQILRIIQEALWNIRKHSQAKTVRILLRDSQDDQFHILIEDDGVGINKQVYGSPGEHVGLTIMRERASKIGGELRVESEPGEGTRVVLEIRHRKADNKRS
jgi:two-component system, NarL family, nitrate/nitrite sensor histidine kinase NarX